MGKPTLRKNTGRHWILTVKGTGFGGEGGTWAGRMLRNIGMHRPNYTVSQAGGIKSQHKGFHRR